MEDRKVTAVFKKIRFSDAYDILIYEKCITSYYVDGEHYFTDGIDGLTYKKDYCEDSEYVYIILEGETDLLGIIEITNFNDGVGFVLDKFEEKIIKLYERYDFEEFVSNNEFTVEKVFPEDEFKLDCQGIIKDTPEENKKEKEPKKENVVRNKEDLVETKKNILNIKKLEKILLSKTIGQNEQIRDIISAIYGHYYLGLKNNMLIIGPSGVGKTYILEQIANGLGIPYFIEDATQYTAEGFVGKSVNEMLVHLLEVSESLEQAQNGLLIIDEIDKKGGNSKGSSEVNKKDVLTSLLSILQGRVINVEVSRYEQVKFDTSNLMIVSLGAFTDVREQKDKQPVGFNKSILDQRSRNSKVEYDKLREYGMTDEFIGRMELIIELNELTKENLYQIITDENISPYNVYYQACQSKGVMLEINDLVSKKIVEEAMKKNTGARAIKNIVNQLFLPIAYEIFSEDILSYDKIIADDIISENGIVKINFIKEKQTTRKMKKKNI